MVAREGQTNLIEGAGARTGAEPLAAVDKIREKIRRRRHVSLAARQKSAFVRGCMENPENMRKDRKRK